MKDMIKEVALSNAREYLTFKLGGRKGLDIEEIVGDDEIYTEIVNELSEQFVAFLAELSKRAEAVGIAKPYYNRSSDQNIPDARWIKTVESGTKLFTFPPIHDIEAIENRVAEACAEYVSINLFSCGEYAEAIRSGEWRKYLEIDRD